MMGHCGVWTAWGPWSDCPKCKPYGQSVVVKERLRECQVDGEPKDDCAGFKQELKKCDVPTCEAEYKDNSHCNETKPEKSKNGLGKVCIFSYVLSTKFFRSTISRPHGWSASV